VECQCLTGDDVSVGHVVDGSVSWALNGNMSKGADVRSEGGNSR